MRDLWRWLRKQQSHEAHNAQFTSAAVHFTMTAEVIGHLNLAQGARRLLNSELAVSAAWPSEDKIRVTKRLRSLARSLRRARGLNEAYSRAKKEGTWIAGIRFTLRYPKFGILHLRALWAPRIRTDLKALVTQKTTVFRILIFSIKHPIFGFRHVIPKMRIQFGKNHESSTTTAHPDEFDDAEEDNVTDSNGDESNDPDATLREAERLILDQQVISAVERSTDSRLFGGPSHDEDRFVRLQLRNSYHDFLVPKSSGLQYVVFEPRLLIHESGVIQLELCLSTDGPLSTEQVISLMWSPEPRIKHSAMSTPLLEKSGWESRVSKFDDDLDVGKPLAHIDHNEPVSMTEVLGVHLNAVMAVLRVQRGSWVNYPVAIVTPGDCCPDGEWRENHASDVQLLAIRAYGDYSIAPHVEPLKDLSMKSEQSLFATLGSATFITWKGEPPSGIEDLNTVLILEYAILIYMRLQIMEAKVAQMSLDERALQIQYRDAIELFSELRQGNARAGEIRDIISHVLQELGADNMRSTIDSALNLAGVAHSTANAARASRRSWWITLLATMISTLVAIPPLRQLFDDVKSAPPDTAPAWLTKAIKSIDSLGFWGPWTLIGMLFATIFSLMALGWLIRHRPRHLPHLHRGYAWPTRITVMRSASNDNGRPGTTNSSAVDETHVDR